MTHAKSTGEMTAGEIDAAADKGAIPSYAVAPETAAFDFSPEGANLAHAILKKARIILPEFNGGGAPQALGIYRGAGIYHIAAAGETDDGGMPSEFYRLARDSMWVESGKEAKTDYFRNYENEALAILKIDRASAADAVARKRAKHFAGLGVPKGGKFPRFSVNPICFSEAWSAMSSLVNLKHEKDYARVILSTESGLLVGVEPNIMAIRANASLGSGRVWGGRQGGGCRHAGLGGRCPGDKNGLQAGFPRYAVSDGHSDIAGKVGRCRVADRRGSHDVFPARVFASLDVSCPCESVGAVCGGA